MRLFAKKDLASITAPINKLLTELTEFIEETKAEIAENDAATVRMDQEHIDKIFHMNVAHNTAMNALHDRNEVIYEEQTYAVKLKNKIAELVA